MVTPSHRRAAVSYLQAAYGVSERRACRVTGTSRATHRYRSVADPQDELRLRVRELAATRVRYGYRRIHVLLRREGWPVNHKRVYRLYRDDGLAILTKTPRRRRAPQYRATRSELAAPNQAWAMDFVSDTLAGGQRFRLLTVVDCFSRECLAIVPRVQFRAANVVETLEQLVRERGAPQTIRCDMQSGCALRMLAGPAGRSQDQRVRRLSAVVDSATGAQCDS